MATKKYTLPNFPKYTQANNVQGMMTVEQKVREILQLTGWRQGELAERLGTTQATVSRWLSGSDPKGEHHAAIDNLHREVTDNVPTKIGKLSSVPLMGYIGAGAEIEPEYEQVPPEGLDQVEVPFPLPEDMIAFEVRGDSMLPVYKHGFLIVAFKEQKRPLSAFFGEDAIVRTGDGRRFIKTIQRGADGLVNLFSFNAPMIENVRLEWIGEIFAVLPRTQIKNISRAGGIQGRLSLSSGG